MLGSRGKAGSTMQGEHAARWHRHGSNLVFVRQPSNKRAPEINQRFFLCARRAALHFANIDRVG